MKSALSCCRWISHSLDAFGVTLGFRSHMQSFSRPQTRFRYILRFLTFSTINQVEQEVSCKEEGDCSPKDTGLTCVKGSCVCPFYQVFQIIIYIYTFTYDHDYDLVASIVNHFDRHNLVAGTERVILPVPGSGNVRARMSGTAQRQEVFLVVTVIIIIVIVIHEMQVNTKGAKMNSVPASRVSIFLFSL